uniref:Uncharacterized protein n=1 Tax=Arundo donax TaxID=35708 RepID=A0A0A9BNF8_ARUDO
MRSPSRLPPSPISCVA